MAQGLGITLAVLGMYYLTMQRGDSITAVLTTVFTTLVLSNIFLTLVNRSFTQSVFRTLRVPNWMLWLILGL
jgi:Ca2+-transporting ATPase